MSPETDDVSFAVVRRGYDRAQVEASFDKLATELDTAVSARDAARDELRSLARQLDASRTEVQETRATVTSTQAEVERLSAQVSELSTIPSTVDGMSERLQQMVRIAQDDANDMRSRATTNAAQVLTLAQAEADELRERSRTERQAFETERRTAEESLREQLEESRVQLEHLRNDRDGQIARLDAELAQRRALAEKELATEMEERRAAILDELGVQESRRRAEAIRILDVASEEARTHVAEATTQAQRIRAEAQSNVGDAHRELDELRALQHRVSEQLTSVRALLDWTLPRIGVPSEPPVEVRGPDEDLRVLGAEPREAGVPGGRVEPVDLGRAAPVAPTGRDSDESAPAAVPDRSDDRPHVEGSPGSTPEPEKSARPTPIARGAGVGAAAGRNGGPR